MRGSALINSLWRRCSVWLSWYWNWNRHYNYYKVYLTNMYSIYCLESRHSSRNHFINPRGIQVYMIVLSSNFKLVNSFTRNEMKWECQINEFWNQNGVQLSIRSAQQLVGNSRCRTSLDFGTIGCESRSSSMDLVHGSAFSHHRPSWLVLSKPPFTCPFCAHFSSNLAKYDAIMSIFGFFI